LSHTTVDLTTARRGGSGSSSFLYRHVWLRLVALLSVPLLWLVLVYIVALAALLITALWQVDSLSGQISQVWNLDNIKTVLTEEIYRTVTLRTLGIAAAVTVIDVLIAIPIAFYMAKVASPRVRRLLVVAVLTPLWASYLVKAFAWRATLAQGGVLEWLGSPFGVQSPGYGVLAIILTQSYIWLPYVILPIYAALERVPDSLVDASSDLGARPWRSFRSVVFPLLIPGIIAGSIFSFSLTMGDYITTSIVGGNNQMLGTLVYTYSGAANNLPLAAAIALIPIAVMIVFLTAVRRTGALNNL
jgi:putative spermidine/putrescine transport system permease protein